MKGKFLINSAFIRNMIGDNEVDDQGLFIPLCKVVTALDI